MATSLNSEFRDPQLAEDMQTVITLLMRVRHMTRTHTCRRLHISEGTWYRRLQDGNWTAHDLVALADLFEVEVGSLFKRPDDLLQNWKYLTPLTVIDGGRLGEEGPKQLELNFDRLRSAS